MARRSLGTLTIDVVAEIGGFASGLDKSERQAEKWRAKVEKEAKAAGVALGIGISAAITGLAALTIATANHAVEVGRLAQVSGVGAVEFQRYAAGANAFGIQQEKLADIFKDTQDKVGDFLQNGGGPLADFFDNIAPKVGVTAKNFQNLSGPQALQLYVDSLEKANISQGDMVFYMEAIASDATMLLPLLRNGGEGFNEFADAAERAGAIMGDDVVAAGQRLKVETWLVQQQLDGFKNNLVSEILPVIVDLGATLLGSGQDARKAMADYNVIGTVIRWLAQATAGGVAAFELLGKTIGGTAAILASLPDGLDAALRTRATVADDLAKTADYWGTVISDMSKAGTEAGRASAEVQKLQDLLAQQGPKGGTAGSQGRDAEAAKAAAAEQMKLDQAFASTNLQYQRQIELFDESADKSGKATELQKLNFELASGALRGLNQQQMQTLRLQATEIDRLESIKTANEEAAKATEAYAKLKKELNKEDEIGLDLARDRLKIIQAAAAAGPVSNDDYFDTARKAIAQVGGKGSEDYDGPDAMYGGARGEFEKINKAEEAENKRYAAQLEALDGYRKSRSELEEEWNAEEERIKAEHEDRLAGLERSRRDVALAAAETGFAAVVDIMRESFGEQSGIYRAAFAASKAFSIAKAALAAKDAVSSALSSGLPFPANLVAMATAAAAVANLVGQVSAVGMAHDGIDSVPQDGTWLLQKGERVMTSQTSAKLDATLDRVNRDSAPGGAANGDTFQFNVNGSIGERERMMMAEAVRMAVSQSDRKMNREMANGTGISRTMRATHNVGRRVG